jgi:hypothetical protein
MSAKPTAGPWVAEYEPEADYPWCVRSDLLPYIASVINSIHDGEEEANARLIAEAGTVYHETGLTPRQLAEQRAELIDALESVAVYGSDTLIGPSPGTPDDRAWQRDGVKVMVRRARAALGKVRGS